MSFARRSRPPTSSPGYSPCRSSPDRGTNPAPPHTGSLESVTTNEGRAMVTTDAAGPTQTELADLVMIYAVSGGREGTEMTSADRDTPAYLYCQNTADVISELVRAKSDVPTRRE